MSIPKCPLPFIGNKSKFVKEILKYKDELEKRINEDTIIIDVFGGSGILAKTFKKMFPDNMVIYNDYDDFHTLFNKDFETKINAWLEDVRKITNTYPDKSSKINEKDCEKIHNLIIEHFGPIEEIDFKILRIIMSNIEFQGVNNLKNNKIRKSLYNRVRKHNYEIDEHYYDDLIIEKLDYKELINKYESMNDNLFLIMDPPYLSTNAKYYNNDKYFNLKDLSNIIKLLKKYNCLFFEGSKSDIYGLFEILKEEGVVDYDLLATKKQLNNKKELNESMWLFKPIEEKAPANSIMKVGFKLISCILFLCMLSV